MNAGQAVKRAAELNMVVEQARRAYEVALANRNAQIVAARAEGATYRQIAAALGLAISGVQNILHRTTQPPGSTGRTDHANKKRA